MPKNTEVSTQWAINNFDQWRVDYNSRHPEYPCPDGTLLSDSSSDLSFWGVYIRWNGTVEWNGGMERWNGIVEWNGGIVE